MPLTHSLKGFKFFQSSGAKEVAMIDGTLCHENECGSISSCLFIMNQILPCVTGSFSLTLSILSIDTCRYVFLMRKMKCEHQL